MDTTAKLSTFVLFILIGARVFSLTFYGIDGHKWVEELLANLPGGQLGFLIAVNVLVFLLAFFLDFFELAFIIVPLLVPVAEKLGIDLIWFGVLLGVNMQTSFMHPPFGFALFYLRSVAPAKEYLDKVTGRLTAPVTTGQIYWGAVPFVVIQVIMVGLVIAFPQMVLVYKDEASAGRSVEDPVRDPRGGPGRAGERSHEGTAEASRGAPGRETRVGRRAREGEGEDARGKGRRGNRARASRRQVGSGGRKKARLAAGFPVSAAAT